MDNRRRNCINNIYYTNHFNNLQKNPNSNSINLNNQNRHQYTNQNYKHQSIKSDLTSGNNSSKIYKPNNSLNLNYSNNSFFSKENGSTNNIDEQSNTSNSTIKSMINNIRQKNSFQDAKKKENPKDVLNNSNTKINNSINHKCITTFSSLNNERSNRRNYIYEPDTKSQNSKKEDPKHISLIIKQKIENSKINEEIILPSSEINLENLTITKPVKIKGQSNSCLYINEGHILIDFESFNNNYGINDIKNNTNNIVKISQLRIIFNDNKINKERKITTLFEIHSGSFLEIEDCDIVFQNKKNEPISSAPPKVLGGNKDKKSVAFLLFSNKKKENSNHHNFIPSILNLTNTRIHNFYQSIRAGQNCIVNINKSAFIQNYGKAIVMINPITLKINEALFEYNEDNAIHIKFMDDCLYEEKRKLLFNKNDFETTIGNNLCIEGERNKKLDLSIIITKNNFHNSASDGVLIYDLIYNSFEISDNIFRKNNGNGLNIQKSFFIDILNNKSLNHNLYQPIKIKNNQFIENKGFGFFINDCIFEVISNKFLKNRQSGMILCNIIIDDPQKGLEGINLRSIKGNFSSILKSIKKSSVILKNSFYENGESGLYIYGYPYHINIEESVFSSNFSHGISVDLDPLYNSNNNLGYKDFYTKLNEYKSINENQKLQNLSNIYIKNCVIEKNLKNGLLLNSCLVYCEESFILSNINYAISIKKKDFQHCFKEGKKNSINGSIGGDWGEIYLNKDMQCGFSCMPKSQINYKKKEEIVKKVPSYLNQSEDGRSISESYELRKREPYKNIGNNKKDTSPVKKFNREEFNDDEEGCYIF